MSNDWKRICDDCKYIHAQDPNQHCYMFRDAPDGTCMQNSKLTGQSKSLLGLTINLKRAETLMKKHGRL